MRILVSNDDGIDAPGIAALAEAVADLGEVIVVAPDSAQSGAGHGITVHHPMTVRTRPVVVSVNGQEKSIEGYSVDGRPADCVRLAVRELLSEPVDLILSGVNEGANDGICVFYSGTVAAAAEGAILGVPSIAFSARNTISPPIDFPTAAGHCRRVLDKLIATGLEPGDLVNVNVPSLVKPGWPKGIRVAPMSTAELADHFVLLDESENERIFKTGSDFNLGPSAENSDSIVMREGYITVTPLQVDMTRHSRVADWLEREW
jgi:5'-nucleotidase